MSSNAVHNIVEFSVAQEYSEVQFEEHSGLICQIAKEHSVPVDLIRQILELEPAYRNLHAWGARPALRRALAALVDKAFESETPDG